MSSLQPRLLTLGPLALAPEVEAAMRTDLGSRDVSFRQVTADIRNWILDIAGANQTHSVVPLQGSGTFAIEGVLSTFIKDKDKVLVCVNGVYRETAAKILRRHGLQHQILPTSITQPVSADTMAARLAGRRSMNGYSGLFSPVTLTNNAKDCAGRTPSWLRQIGPDQRNNPLVARRGRSN